MQVHALCLQIEHLKTNTWIFPLRQLTPEFAAIYNMHPSICIDMLRKCVYIRAGILTSRVCSLASKGWDSEDLKEKVAHPTNITTSNNSQILKLVALGVTCCPWSHLEPFWAAQVISLVPDHTRLRPPSSTPRLGPPRDPAPQWHFWHRNRGLERETKRCDQLDIDFKKQLELQH